MCSWFVYCRVASFAVMLDVCYSLFRVLFCCRLCVCVLCACFLLCCLLCFSIRIVVLCVQRNAVCVCACLCVAVLRGMFVCVCFGYGVVVLCCMV